jgi:hypothetical protein
MWRFGVAIASALVLLFGVTSLSDATAHHQPSQKCPLTRAHAIAADSQAQLFLREASSNLSEPFEAEYVYGCAYGHRHVYRLGFPYEESATGSGGIRREVLTGTVVAYESSSSEGANGEGRSTSIVVVRDLRSGRVLHEVPTVTQTGPKVVGSGEAVALLIKSDGAVAWLNRAARQNGTYQVHALDKSGNRLVAGGPEIDPSSLALGGSTLYWTQAGVPMSAPLN